MLDPVTGLDVFTIDRFRLSLILGITASPVDSDRPLVLDVGHEDLASCCCSSSLTSVRLLREASDSSSGSVVSCFS
jgi:hypothetical protein